MPVSFLLDVFRENLNNEAIVWKDEVSTYNLLLRRIDDCRAVLDKHPVRSGAVIAILGDFSPMSIAMLLALVERGAVVVPFASFVDFKVTELMELAQVENTAEINEKDDFSLTATGRRADHPLYHQLIKSKHPGLVLFSSGSTGVNKAAVHDFAKLLEKFKKRRHNFRTLTFLLLDHIGGMDTLFYTLSNGSCVITVRDRSPDAVCSVVERWKVEVLPVTPTFLNLLLISKAHERHDLSSLKYITYGTEVMPESTLKQVARLFPNIILLQKYGTTETGTLRSKSLDSNTTWVRIGGEGYQTRIVDGMLEIKAESAMLGYLNAPSPFTSDGWFKTGDLVEQQGDYVRFLGRKSDVINVGGEKVFPAEVENIIQQVENVAEVTVFGEKNALTGNIVCAEVRSKQPEDSKELIHRIKAFCRGKLENYKIPIKITVIKESRFSERFKKSRPKERAAE